MGAPQSAIQVLVGSARTSLKVETGQNEQSGLQLFSSPTEKQALMQNVAHLVPDVVVVDTPGAATPNRVITDIRHVTPHTRVVAVTERGHPEEVVEAFIAGAVGTLSADSTPDETVAVIKAAMQRRTFLPDSHVVKLILDEFYSHSRMARHLTAWERTILQHLKKERPSDRLGMEKNSLEKHFGNIMTKMFEMNHPQPARSAS